MNNNLFQLEVSGDVSPFFILCFPCPHDFLRRRNDPPRCVRPS